MKLDTRLRAGEVITDRERFLLGVIAFIDDQDCWYLDQAPEMIAVLAEDFAFERDPTEGT